jgi:TPR repeat protein
MITIAAAISIALAFLAIAPPEARSEELRTEVVEVSQDGRIKLMLPAGHPVRVGDQVAISTAVPNVGTMTLDTRWRIETIGDGFATAGPLGPSDALPRGNYGALGLRYTAVIATSAVPAAAAARTLLDWYRAKAERGDADAMLRLGMHYRGHMPLTGESAQPDLKEAERWLSMAAERRNAAAACELAAINREAANTALAARWTRQAAEAGDPPCMYRLGLMLLKGDGLAKNETEAFAWIKKASDAGVVAATFELARLHQAGLGTRADPYELGTNYMTGQGVAKDETEARRWFAEGAALGEPESTFWLAMLTERGMGGGRDSKEAARLMMLALRGGSPYAGNLLQHPGEWSPAFWRELQVLLRQAGVYQGAQDGQFGPTTVRSIVQVMKTRNLFDGQVR